MRVTTNADAAVMAAAVQVPVPLDEYHYAAGTGIDDSLLAGSLADEQKLCGDHSESQDCTLARCWIFARAF